MARSIQDARGQKTWMSRSVAAGSVGAYRVSLNPPAGHFPGRTHAGSPLPAIAALLGCVVFAVALFQLSRLDELLPRFNIPKNIEFPGIVALSLNDARTRANSLGLELVVMGERPSERYPSGTIVQQSPVAGWKVDAERALRVTISSGLIVPDVRGKSLQDAQSRLTRIGWSIPRIEYTRANGAQAGVVDLQFPAPGGRVEAPGEMVLAITR